VKLFVARFWSDFKEWEAVCANYFCAGVPFWEWGYSSESVAVVRAKPEPFLNEPQKRFGTPAGFNHD
jgi:hypothetical protein